MESCLAQSCAASVQGSSPLIFHQLIQALLVSQCSLSSPIDYPPNRNAEILENSDPFDFIIVGGGTAGSAVASRLSENPNWRVLLIEAGAYPSALSDVPAMLLFLQGTPEDYAYEVEYQEGMCQGTSTKKCKWGKGRVLGGSSVLNAMLHIHGNDRDFDSWAALGNDGWSFKDVLPYFKKSESYSPEFIGKFGDKYVGSSGQINIRDYNYTDSGLQSVLLDAVRERGIPVLDHFNGERYIGFGRAQGTLDKGRRVNAAKAYLSPVKDRKNLFVATSTRADRILMEGNKAVGVRLTFPDDKSVDLKASKEVIISAGAIATPQVLMLSGIGPKKHLDELGIPCVADLPVGKNLQDHLIWMGLHFEFFNESGVIKTPLDYLDNAYLYLIHTKGEFIATGGIDLLGFVNLEDPISHYPNIQFHHIHISKGDVMMLQAVMNSIGLSEELQAELMKLTIAGDSLMMCPTLLNPRSRGEIKLRSTSPSDTVKIWANYLDSEEDKVELLKSVEFLKSLEVTDVMKKHGIKLRHFKIPGCKEFTAGSMEYWECNLRHTAATVYHPVGTARMGPAGDAAAVVDPKLRVHGVKGLRVIDASIMPTVTSGNTNSPTLMIAEKGADMVKKEWSSRDEL
ncbi:glucose dehydrogenase [FAD, quinone] [Diachasma alloeum]|uniref:glucose dehydrogenase [FAD, quinone] n=1 Tax=Diachasma alloeum TaxID=454923 RepID=UPI000738452B|nr:glucose dehydrogenase [FAD, quinone] [Diachasma alloeum]